MPRKTEQGASETYRRGRMQREMIIRSLRERGCRITRQREILLDIILDSEYSCCKEIYYKASQRDENIGTATVYRMIKTLEEIGAITRNNMYKISCSGCEAGEEQCVIELDDDTAIELSPHQWKQVVKCGLNVCGYTKNQDIRCVSMTAPGTLKKDT